MYNYIKGYAKKKDLNFEMVVKVRFNEGEKIAQIIDMVNSKNLTILNAKEVMYKIVDGDLRSPHDIALHSQLLGAKDIDVRHVVKDEIAKEEVLVGKIIKSGAQKPLL